MAKGITPIIAIIILLLITVAIAGMGWSYINMYAGGLMAKQIEVTTAMCAKGEAMIVLKNIGTEAFTTDGIRLTEKQTGKDITDTSRWIAGVEQSGTIIELNFNDQANPGRDTSGNGINCVLMGAAWTTYGKFGGAVKFDGVNDYINCGSSPVFSPQKITIMAWVNRTVLGPTYQRIVSKNGHFEMDLNCSLYLTNSTGFRANITNLTGNSNQVREYSSQPTTLNQWSHVATVYDGQYVKIYLNGVEVLNRPYPGTLGTGSYPDLIIGAIYQGSPQYPFSGVIDDVKIYSNPLSPAQIAGAMNNIVTVEPGGLATIAANCSRPVCNYVIISSGSAREASVSC